MSPTLLVTSRELRSYMRSPLGYVVAAAILLIDGIYFYAAALGNGARLSADVLFRFFDGANVTTMIAAIILSMRLFAGERENGTFVLLNTSPIHEWQVVIGKFFAAMSLLLIMAVLTIYMPMLIFVNGKVSIGHIVVGYSGLLLLAATALSMGLFASAIAPNQVVAAIVGAALIGTFGLLFLVARVTEPPLNDFVSALNIYPEGQKSFMKGILRLDGIVYYLAMILFFLVSTTKILEARRWR